MFNLDDIDLDKLEEQSKVGNSILKVLEKKYPLDNTENAMVIISILIHMVRQLVFLTFNKDDSIYIFNKIHKILIDLTNIHFNLKEEEDSLNDSGI